MECKNCGHGCHCSDGSSCQSCECANCEHQMAQRGIKIVTYERGPKKRTSIGDSSRSRPKNKHTRRQHKRSVGQGR